MNVTLELVDHATGNVIAETEAPLESLPPTFAGMETTLTVGDAEYQVVDSDCKSRDEMARAGRVRLVLRKVTMMDPKAILFSLPSIENELPPNVPIPERADVRALLSQDDYRQIELVHDSFVEEIEAEFADIRRVSTEHRRGVGFTECHVRKRIRSPLGPARVTVAEIEAALGIKRRPFAFRAEKGMVRGAFAMPSADAVAYGIEDGDDSSGASGADGVARVLALHGAIIELVTPLQSLAQTHGLSLVDWNQTERRAPDQFSTLRGVRGIALDSRFKA